MLLWWEIIFAVYLRGDYVDLERRRSFFEEVSREWIARREILGAMAPSRLTADEKIELDELGRALTFLSNNADIVRPAGVRNRIRLIVDFVAPTGIFGIALGLLIGKLIFG